MVPSTNSRSADSSTSRPSGVNGVHIAERIPRNSRGIIVSSSHENACQEPLTIIRAFVYCWCNRNPVVILPSVSSPMADTFYGWDPRLPNLLQGPYAQEETRAAGVLTSQQLWNTGLHARSS